LAPVNEEPTDELVTIDNDDADALWDAWAPPGDDDILAHAAFERTLRAVAGLEDEGLYFRPGGWSVNLPATLVRTAVAAGILAALFQIAGLEDLDREIVIAAATLIASMDVSPVRLGRQERRLAERVRQAGLAGRPISAEQAHRTLPADRRREVTQDEIADALDHLADAGLADREGDDTWVIRARGSEAWIRLRLRGN
jgi:hypothetical protein